MSVVDFLRRVVRIIGLFALLLLRLAAVSLSSARAPKPIRSARLAAELVRCLERLGGAFIKVGQLAGTRVDLVGPDVAAALSQLHDHVRPLTARQADQAVRRALPGLAVELAGALSQPPVASGSIASVYRVPVRDGVVALKVRRPDVVRTMPVDLKILGILAAGASRLPGLRRVPMVEIVEQVGRCLVDQLDFTAEAQKLHRLRDHLAGLPDVLVPAVRPEFCGDGVLGMDFIEDLTHASIDRLPVAVREAEIETLVRAVYRLLFVAGFVHVDLHQGNTYFTPGGTVVLLDAGFAFQLSPTAQRRYTEFFGGMIRGDGDICADILRSTVRGATPEADITQFRRSVADLVHRNAGVTAAEFDLPSFCLELFDLQRRFGLYAEPEFIFPMLCLLSLDGLVKEHHPSLDFQMEAAPYVMQSLLALADEGNPGEAAHHP